MQDKTFQKYRQITVSIFFILYVTGIVVVSMPRLPSIQIFQNYRNFVFRALEPLQFWQNWKMFADPPTYNFEIFSEVRFKDGSVWQIKWPWFSSLTMSQKIRFARIGKWMENTVYDQFKISWPSITVAIARVASCAQYHPIQLVDIWPNLSFYFENKTLCSTHNPPVSVTLWRNWKPVLNPGKKKETASFPYSDSSKPELIWVLIPKSGDFDL